MNKNRRDELEKALSLLNEASDIVESVQMDEQDALDNLPESLSESEQYSKMEDAVDFLSDAADSINEAIDYIESAKQ